MRQFFSWRIWAAFGALIACVVLLKAVLPESSVRAQANSPTERKIEYVSWVYVVEPSANFAVVNGAVVGSADLRIDGVRTMHLYQGTIGSNTCTNFTAVGACAVVADLLGDAVIWFALVPLQSGFRIVAPPIINVLDGGFAQLQNGWVVKLADDVSRKCAQETDSLGEFRRKFGPGSTSTIDVVSQRLTVVECSASVKATG